MREEKVEKALNYAQASNQIEDLKVKKEELKEIKNAIIHNRSGESFLKTIIEEEVNQYGKTR